MLLVGLADIAVSARERACVVAPTVSGVLLGAHNVQSRRQLQQLVQALRELRDDDAFLICMDRSALTRSPVCDGFTRLPAPARLGEVWDVEPARAVELAEEHAWLMASELRAVDVDLVMPSPILGQDSDHGRQRDRMLHADPLAIAELGQGLVRGVRLAGMSAVPGYFPVNGRADDASLQPFADAVTGGAEAMMMASAGASEWARSRIDDVLRDELGFEGLVVANDACLIDADAGADVAAYLHACHDAGCDLIPVCRPDLLDAALAAAGDLSPCDSAHATRLRGAVGATWTALEDNPQRDQFIARVQALDGEPAS
ncbi:MAG TPA: glycoside hydrolase family 3 N-terminal domain-containing protein [Oleiagrimonas sp.]|nr:glycoside hydrolase family 3 N-terminal domain-containing protein [Oleiagrimonas sp.]